MRLIREQLTELGLNQGEATLAIMTMQRAPRQTSAGEVGAYLVTLQMQRKLNQLGGNFAETGKVDDDLIRALMQIVGPDWMHRPWYATVEAFLRFEKRKLPLNALVPLPALGDAQQTAAIAAVGVVAVIGIAQWGLSIYGLYCLFNRTKKS